MSPAPHPDLPLRVSFVPWACNGAGDDIWRFENGLILLIQSLLEEVEPAGRVRMTDLFDELGGEKVRTEPVALLGTTQIEILAGKPRVGTSIVLDGALTVSRDGDGAIARIDVTPRLFVMPGGHLETLPTLPFMSAGAPMQPFDQLALAIANGILAAAGVDPIVPDGPILTADAEAFDRYLYAKRLAYYEHNRYAEYDPEMGDDEMAGYEKAIERYPSFYAALLAYGQNVMILSGSSAIPILADAVRAAKGSATRRSNALFTLGNAYAHDVEYEAANEHWSHAREIAPENPTLLTNLASVHEEGRERDEAIRLYAQALAVSPYHRDALLGLARLKTVAGRVGEAIPLYVRALDIEPNDALREALLGGCYLSTGDNENARLHFERASQLDPASDEPHPAGDYARAELGKMGV